MKTRGWPSRARRTLAVGTATTLMLTGATAAAIVSRRAHTAAAVSRRAHTASSSAVGPRCVPTQFNRSAVLAGTTLAVSPLPGSYDASASTQISMVGAPASAIHVANVSGSQTGTHSGSLRAYSQGDGASFVLKQPFHTGETVTVHGSVLSGARTQPFAFSFVVAQPDTGIYSASSTSTKSAYTRDYKEMQHFVSAPTLLAPVTVVTSHSPQATPGDIFSSPYAGPGPSGPMIFDESGKLVWFHPLPSNIASTNLQVQQPNGVPILTWWQGTITEQGFGQGEEVLYNGAYQQIGRVQAGNGFKADLHDFHLSAQNTALLTVFHPIDCDLSAYGGPAKGYVTDGIVQELDLGTGLVRREWHSLDHVPPSSSYSSAAGASPHWPFDYFHPNSIDQLAAQSPLGAVTLISSRNTSALYELNTETGQVLASIGGRYSSVHLAPGTSTAYQHDATVLANGTISLFDNGGVPKVHPQSRGMVVSINPQTNTESVVAQYEHSAPISSGSQGSMQVQEDGDVFMGWGAEPYFSEYSSSGQVLFDAHMHGAYESYRAYRFPWVGAPAQPPAIAISASSAKARVTVYASWNGDTRTTSWRLLGGSSAHQLTPVGGALRSGFETAITVGAAQRYVAVQALNAAGAVLGTSPTIRG